MKNLLKLDCNAGSCYFLNDVLWYSDENQHKQLFWDVDAENNQFRIPTWNQWYQENYSCPNQDPIEFWMGGGPLD